MFVHCKYFLISKLSFAIFAKVPWQSSVDRTTLFIKCEFPSSQMKCELEQWRAGFSPVLNIAVWEVCETCQAVGPTLKENKGLKYLGFSSLPHSFHVFPEFWRSLCTVRPWLCAVYSHFFHITGLWISSRCLPILNRDFIVPWELQWHWSEISSEW